MSSESSTSSIVASDESISEPRFLAEAAADPRRVSDLRHDVLRNALYHTARRRHLEAMGRTMNFIVIIAGAGALADFIPKDYITVVKSTLAAVTLVTGSIQLVYDFSGQARLHEFLQRRFYEILAKIESNTSISEADIHRIRGEITVIYADEPPTLRALDAVAYNAASDSLGGDYRVRVSWLQSITRQYLAWGQASFPWESASHPSDKALPDR